MSTTPYESIVEENNDGIFVAQEGEIVYANGRMEELTGYSEAELIGSSKTYIVAQEDADLVEEYHHARMDGGDAPNRYEIELETKSGERVPVELSVRQGEYEGGPAAISTCRDITEQTQQKRQSLRQEYEAVFDNVQDILFLLDVDEEGTARFQRFNKCEEEFTGMATEDIRGRTPTDIFGEDIGTKFQSNYQKCIDRQETIAYEEALPIGGETTVWQTKLTPVVVDGQVERIVGSSREITELRERKRELEQAQERLRVLFDQAPDSITIHDVDGNVLDGNEKLVENLGYTYDELTSMNVVDFAPELEREEGRALWRGMDVGDIHKVASKHERADGTTFPIEVWVSKIEVQGEPRLLALGRDVSERKEKEKQIRDLKERLELAVEGANLGVWDWDLTTDTVEFNEQWAAMLDYSLEDIESQPDAWKKRVHPDDIDAVEEALDAHLAGETEYYDTEHRMRTADGNWKWIRDIGKVVERDEDGNPVRAVGIHLDVDERKTTEQALKQERDMFTQGPAVVFKWRNEDGWPVEFVSGNVEDVFGYSPDAFTSGDITYREVIHEDDRKRVTRETADKRDGGDEWFSLEPYRIVTADGTVRWMLEHTKTVRNDGEITHLQGYLVDITERREKEIYLEKAQEVGDIGWWRKEIPSDQIYWSERVYEMWGTDGDVGLFDHDTFLEFIHPEDQDEVEQAWRDALEGEPYDIEHRIVTGDGEVKWMRETAEFSYDANGDPVSAVGIVQDITERKEREQELSRYQAFVENSSDVITIISDDGTVEYASPASRRISGHEPEELVGRNATELLHPDDKESMLTELERLITEPEQTITREYRFEDTNGSWMWAESTGINRLDDPDIEGIVLVTRDITERKEREQKLRQFREAVEQTAHSVYITDVDGTIEYVNPAFEDVTGYSQEEAIGRTPDILKSGEHDEEFYEEFWDSITAGQSWEDEMVDVRADGEEIIIYQTVSPITDDEGEPQKFIAIAQDITELKEYEQRLEEQRDNLEVLNQVVRHDIRNDLQVVLTYTETLQSYVKDGGKEYVERILEAGRNAVDITTTARDVTEVMIQSDIELHPVSLRYVLENEIDDIRSSREEALIRVDGSIPGVMVRADDMLESVFRNLLVNAIKHNDKEVSEVTTSVTCNDGTVSVRIADNGPGISEDRKEKVFEKGEIGLDSEGTGLGLYLVDTLVGRYDGDVRVEDNDPEGTVFTVELPRATSESAESVD